MSTTLTSATRWARRVADRCSSLRRSSSLQSSSLQSHSIRAARSASKSPSASTGRGAHGRALATPRGTVSKRRLSGFGASGATRIDEAPRFVSHKLELHVRSVVRARHLARNVTLQAPSNFSRTGSSPRCAGVHCTRRSRKRNPEAACHWRSSSWSAISRLSMGPEQRRGGSLDVLAAGSTRTSNSVTSSWV
jgi:hypothetical protein